MSTAGVWTVACRGQRTELLKVFLMPCLRSDLQAMMMKGMRMMKPWPSPYLGEMVEGDQEDDVLDDEVVVLLQLESLR